MGASKFAVQIRKTIRRYLKWYLVPFAYLLMTGLVCAYAWHTRPVPYRTGIMAVFKTIALMPALILTGLITGWLILAVLSIAISFFLKNPSSDRSSLKPLPLSEYHDGPESFADREQNGMWRKAVRICLSFLGISLIVAGLSIALWISRPYITFLFSTSQIETLEKKAEVLSQGWTGDIKENSTILAKTAVYREQGHGDEIEKSEAFETKPAVPERERSTEYEQSEVLQQKAELVQKDVALKTERGKRPLTLFERVRRDVKKSTGENRNRSEAAEKWLQKNAESHGQVQKDWMIIPEGLVDAEILEGINEENLSLGVCHLSQSAVPGQGGNCIIEGHNIGEFGWWRPQGPFNMIEVLEKGVHIYVFYKGKKYTYRVKEKHYKDADDPTLYDFSPGERLTIITCTSSWSPAVDTDKRTEIIAYPE